MIDNDTTELHNLLNSISNEKDLERYINSTLSPIKTPNIHEYIEELRISKKLKKSILIANSDISREYAYQILKGLKKPSRDNVLKLCLGGSFSLAEANRALKLSGYNELYSKDTRDALLIYFINKSYTVTDANLTLDKHNMSPLGN